ncbi:hypothetical protein M7I_5041 [Glarea lozoyensis 74030]|uniref:Steroid 5-alpha reductase C-terminal domain-containing protein n=1 Tax=Glarea lozoyensis (strain ATCC 74030 / MF5533) TaxID=1104152 RepID=H0EQT4_GLAL7|nr:hypothetical protein M7I_5041 [Glarea lozoyensis 74030]
MNTLPGELGLKSLPWENKAMGGLFTIHYIYRSIISPLLNPSMSPIHPLVWAFAIAFQVVNGLSIGGYLGGHGPTTRFDWQGRADFKTGGRMELGMMIWGLGFIANVWHDDELREIRRAAKRNLQRKMAKGEGKVDKGLRCMDLAGIV